MPVSFIWRKRLGGNNMVWKEYKLGDISKMKYGKLPPKQQYGSYPIWSGYKYVGLAPTFNCRKGTIIVVARGVGGTGDVKISHDDCFLTNLSISVDLDRDFCEPLYFYYKYKLSNLRYLDTGSAQSQITIDDLKRLSLTLPPIEEQNKIVSVLFSLDAKIETNNRLSEKLEELAQAIFKSWFVDFEPFKNGNFVDSELGMIPEGWEVGKIGDLCTFKRGKGLLSKDAILGDVPVVAGGMQPSCYHNVANTQAPVVTVSGSGANAGFTRLYHVNVWASDCSFIDRNCENLYFVYCYLIRNKRLLKHAQTGAVQPHVKPADIHNFETVIPPKDILVQFNSIIEELLSQNGIFEKENQRLANLRDTLLPRLMSGEIKL